MTARAIMLMGTGSDVGKSLMAAGLCRAFANRGLKVVPFKPQNMSNNAAVTVDGGEIGRAQALAGPRRPLEPTVHMNPVLLKPETNTRRPGHRPGPTAATMTARDFFKNRQQFMPAIVESFRKLAAKPTSSSWKGRQPRRNQPARRRSGQYGLCQSRQYSGLSHGRYPPGRRHRLHRRHLRGAR